jgi:hypothetical protein
MIRILKITEKYKNLLFEDATEEVAAEPTDGATPPAEGTEEVPPTEEVPTEQVEGGSEYQAGDIVVYLYKDKTMDDWNALTDEEKSNLEESPASDVVNVKKIEKIEGDKFYFKDKEGNDFTKNQTDIIQKQTPPSTEEPQEGETTETETTPTDEAPAAEPVKETIILKFEDIKE